MSMLKIFVSGPYSAPTPYRRKLNVARAEALAVEVWKLGCFAFCPHKNSEGFEGEVPDSVFLEGDLEILRCFDGLILTEDWVLSAGARGEYHEASMLGIPIFETIEQLREYVADRGVHSDERGVVSWQSRSQKTVG